MQTKDCVPTHERIQMECPWCFYKWTHIFIKKTPPQIMKCSKCGKFAKNPQYTEDNSPAT